MGDFGVVRRRWAGIGLAAVAVAAGGVGIAVPASAGTADIVGAGTPGAVPGSYIVVLRDGPVAATTLAARYGGKVEHVYSAAIKGYAAAMSERDARRAAADPAVKYVVQNHLVQA